MSLFVGSTDVSKAYIGNTVASAVYVGSTKVWPTAPTPAIYQGWTAQRNPGSYGISEIALPPHQPGDVFVFNYVGHVPAGAPAAEGSVPQWNYAGSGQQIATYWARATRSDHTSGRWEINGWSWQVALIRGAAPSGTAVGGITFFDMVTSAGGNVTVPGVNLARTDGTSLLLTMGMASFAEQPIAMDIPQAGYTRREWDSWMWGAYAYSGFCITKDSSVDSATFNAGAINLATAVRVMQMEVLSH